MSWRGLGEDALNELNDSDCLRQAACVESVKIGRLAVERLSSKADFEYVVKHGSVGNVRNLAKRYLREKYPEKDSELKESFDHKEHKAKGIIKSLHAIEMLGKWEDLVEEFEANCKKLGRFTSSG